MKYKIYTLDGKEELVPDGYHTATVIRNTLSCSDYSRGYDSSEEAEAYLRKHIYDFKSSTVVILPVFEINYKGEIEGEDETM